MFFSLEILTEEFNPVSLKKIKSLNLDKTEKVLEFLAFSAYQDSNPENEIKGCSIKVSISSMTIPSTHIDGGV